MVSAPQLYFEDVFVGMPLPIREFGPLTIINTVRWAGFQENTARLHYDRDYAHEHSGLKSFIASGAYRQALLLRALTDWIGPRAHLRKFSLRHLYPTFEGDLMRFSGRVTELSSGSNDFCITCELQGNNQENRQILTGHCDILLPTRSHGQAQ
jgi:acyl dehydratase